MCVYIHACVRAGGHAGCARFGAAACFSCSRLDVFVQVEGLILRPEYHLLDAAGRGNLEKAQNAVANGAVVNCCDAYDRTPMMIACNEGHKTLVIYLLQLDAGACACTRFVCVCVLLYIFMFVCRCVSLFVCGVCVFVCVVVLCLRVCVCRYVCL